MNLNDLLNEGLVVVKTRAPTQNSGRPSMRERQPKTPILKLAFLDNTFKRIVRQARHSDDPEDWVVKDVEILVSNAVTALIVSNPRYESLLLSTSVAEIAATVNNVKFSVRFNNDLFMIKIVIVFESSKRFISVYSGKTKLYHHSTSLTARETVTFYEVEAENEQTEAP